MAFVITKGGVESPGRIQEIAGRSWQIYATCRRHACSDQAITMAISPDGEAYLYLHGKKQPPTFLGDVPEPVKPALVSAHQK